MYIAEMIGTDHQVNIDEYMAENFGVAESNSEDMPGEEANLIIMLESKEKNND